MTPRSAIQSPTESPTKRTDEVVRPFLKWARTFGAYHEPFVGSGAVFFDLFNRGLLLDRRAILIDRNADLTGCYLMVRDRVDAVIRHLAKLAREYRKSPKEHYYLVRNEQFNPQRQRIFNGTGPDSSRYTPALAAKLIYLNRTGFNGLFRVNSAGMFNVPIGRYANPSICDRQNLRLVSRALIDISSEILQSGFESVLDRAQAGDFLYFDPPYAPLSRTALFTSYTAAGFTLFDQQRLQEAVVELARRGCWVVLSNSTAPEVAALYDGNRAATGVGLKAYTVPARRAINSNASRRGTVMEYIISNVPPAKHGD